MADSVQDKAQAAHARIIARAWSDPAFKAELLADPHKVLAAAGIELKPGVTVKVVENTDSLHHLVLPPKPSGELSDADLDKVAGGTFFLVPALAIGMTAYAETMSGRAASAASAATSGPLPAGAPAWAADDPAYLR